MCGRISVWARIALVLLASFAIIQVAAAGTLNTWSPTGELSTARDGHTATLLPSGKVLAAGGIDSNGDEIASAELYDPASNNWSSADALSAARAYHTATLLPSGQVLVAGGDDSTGLLPGAAL